MRFNKKILILGTLLFAAAGCNFGAQNQTNNQNPNPQPQPTPQTQLQTYNYQPEGFQFQYPADLVFTAPNYAALEDKIVQVQLTQDSYPKTNFVDAAFTVSSQFAKDLNTCLAVVAEGAQFKTTSKTTINGIDFYTANGSGAGAGNFYETHYLRTLHGSTCIELAETLHTANIDNFTPGTVTEVDHNAVFKRLEQISNTFRFNQQAQSEELTGMSGTATISPTCPVQKIGETCSRPAANLNIAVFDSSGKQAAVLMTNADGNFKVLLPPGTYTLKVQGSAPYPVLRNSTVTIGPKVITAVSLDFDSGIR